MSTQSTWVRSDKVHPPDFRLHAIDIGELQFPQKLEKKTAVPKD